MKKEGFQPFEKQDKYFIVRLEYDFIGKGNDEAHMVIAEEL